MGLLPLRRISSLAASPQPRGDLHALAAPDFESVYEQNFKFVWRAARRLGINPGDTDDVVQEVFVVAHRKLPEFEGRAQVKTWLLKILVRVVRHYFRTQQRKPGHRPAYAQGELDSLRDVRTCGPSEAAERQEAVRVLDRLLSCMDSEKREVLVLAEIEQLSSVEIAEVLGTNINTIYSRLRAARQEFERAVTRFQTHELGETP